jgi:hypothetical protein
VVRLRAYYWSQDEKLLIADFVPNGNLATALRGMYMIHLIYMLFTYKHFGFAFVLPCQIAKPLQTIVYRIGLFFNQIRQEQRISELNY